MFIGLIFATLIATHQPQGLDARCYDNGVFSYDMGADDLDCGFEYDKLMCEENCEKYN